MVNFELSEKMKKGFFKSWQEHGIKEKKFYVHEESNLRPSDSTLWCSTTEPQRLYSEQGHYKVFIFLIYREVITVYANMIMMETGIYLQLFLATFN